MFCFQLHWFDFHLIESLYTSEYNSDNYSIASEHQP